MISLAERTTGTAKRPLAKPPDHGTSTEDDDTREKAGVVLWISADTGFGDKQG